MCEPRRLTTLMVFMDSYRIAFVTLFIKLTCRPWEWVQFVSPKRVSTYHTTRRYIPKMIFFMIAMRISNLTGKYVSHRRRSWKFSTTNTNSRQWKRRSNNFKLSSELDNYDIRLFTWPSAVSHVESGLYATELNMWPQLFRLQRRRFSNQQRHQFKKRLVGKQNNESCN
jgi:hypothetical protein